LEDSASLIYHTISTTLAEQGISSTIIEPWKGSVFNASLLASKGIELLLDAYESVRPHNTNDFTHAACMAVAIYTVSPIREIGVADATSKKLKTLNELCALKSVQSFLQLEPSDLDPIVWNNSLHGNKILVRSDFLNCLVKAGAEIVVDASTVLHFNRLPSYYDYNGDCDIDWREIDILDELAKIFALWATNRSFPSPLRDQSST
jgi:hypothetical protein